MLRVRELADALLELSIVGSFSRVGSAVRRRLFRWQEPVPGALSDRTVLVTGPTSGLGRATAEAMADLGARVVLLGRSQERLERLRAELSRRSGEDRFAVVIADMSSLTSVRQATELIARAEPRLDILIDNAGAISPERRVTAEGLELTFATMVAGPFVLVSGLLPLLEATPGARVISVVSGGMYGQSLPLDDLQFERGPYDGTRAYARAKRASMTLVREWSRRHRGTTRFDAMHPGWADTPGLAESLPRFYRAMRPWLRSPADGADTITWLATADDASLGRDGRLWLDRRPRPFDRAPFTRLDPRQRRRLWEEVVRVSGGVDPTA